eukprot:359802-Chlamydomonas_euryale.AAC.11
MGTRVGELQGISHGQSTRLPMRAMRASRAGGTACSRIERGYARMHVSVSVCVCVSGEGQGREGRPGEAATSRFFEKTTFVLATTGRKLKVYASGKVGATDPVTRSGNSYGQVACQGWQGGGRDDVARGSLDISAAYSRHATHAASRPSLAGGSCPNERACVCATCIATEGSRPLPGSGTIAVGTHPAGALAAALSGRHSQRTAAAAATAAVR